MKSSMLNVLITQQQTLIRYKIQYLDVVPSSKQKMENLLKCHVITSPAEFKEKMKSSIKCLDVNLDQQITQDKKFNAKCLDVIT